MPSPVLVSASVVSESGTLYLNTLWNPGTTSANDGEIPITLTVDIGGRDQYTATANDVHSTAIDIGTGYINIKWVLSSQAIYQGQYITCDVPSARVYDNNDDAQNLAVHANVTNNSPLYNPIGTPGWGGRSKPHIDRRDIFR